MRIIETFKLHNGTILAVVGNFQNAAALRFEAIRCSQTIINDGRFRLEDNTPIEKKQNFGQKIIR